MPLTGGSRSTCHLRRGIDWSSIEAQRDVLVEGGQRFFGADDRHGVRASTRGTRRVHAGAEEARRRRREEFFGAGELDASFPRGRRPVFQTDLLRRTLGERDAAVTRLVQRGTPRRSGVRVVVASTDVHELAVSCCAPRWARQGAEVIDFGISRDPEDIARGGHRDRGPGA